MDYASKPADEQLLPSRMRRLQSLDVWRGLACIFVVIYHSTYFACHGPAAIGSSFASLCISITGMMWVGVPLFFVISGYCIATTADRARRQPKGVANYFVRRFRRIFPPYWAAILASIGFVALATTAMEVVLPDMDVNWELPPVASLSASQWLGNCTLTESWRSNVGGNARQYFLGQSWTLCYEEQFYAVVGILLMLCPRRIFMGSAAVTGATVVIRPVAKLLGISVDGFFFDGHWLLFAVGILVYYRLSYAKIRVRAGCDALLLAVSGIVLWRPAALYHFNSAGAIELANGAETKMLVACLFGLQLVALHRWDAWFASSRIVQPMRFCGRICYSLYLTHVPIAVGVSGILYAVGVVGSVETLLITVPTCVAASVLAGWMFFRLVESHFQSRMPAGIGSK